MVRVLRSTVALMLLKVMFVITMDADLQDSPDEIPELYRMIMEEKYDLVSGYKQKRYDPLTKTIPTKLFNATARKISGVHNLHDFNCGLKAYRRDVVKNIKYMARCTVISLILQKKQASYV